MFFWTRIWSGRGDGVITNGEQWDDGNTNNGDGSKGRCPDHLLAYIQKLSKMYWFLSILRLKKILYIAKVILVFEI